MTANGNSKRDGQHETPRKSAPTRCGPTHPYDLRERKVQASVDKNATAIVSKGSDGDNGVNEVKVSSRQNVQMARCCKKTGHRKTFAPEFQQEQHHSEFRDLPDAQPSSLEKGVKPELYRKHSVRETNISKLERERQQPINYPKPADRIWANIVVGSQSVG